MWSSSVSLCQVLEWNVCVYVLWFDTLTLPQVMGSLADQKCAQGQRVSGILVKKNFNYHILNPSDLSSEYLLDLSFYLIPNLQI